MVRMNVAKDEKLMSFMSLTSLSICHQAV